MFMDIRRIRTILGNKGNQWEPISYGKGGEERPADFIASRGGAASFFGTTLSIGKERPYDGRAIKVVLDSGEKAARHARLMGRLEAAVKPLHRAALEAGLPSVVAVVNHDPNHGFEDLSDLLKDPSAGVCPCVDLFIWFDDFRSDRMLYRRSDPAAYEMLFDWFNAADFL
jgi:hypothetical protein